MPNYVKNKVNFYGDAARIMKLNKFLRTEKEEFDFNKIIPMPESLNITAGSIEQDAIAFAKAKNDPKKLKELKQRCYNHTVDEMITLGEQYLRNKELYGATTWYDWCCNNWGTKWNACDAEWLDYNYVVFDTAWATPEPIFTKLSELYPDIEFEVSFADEDLGNNCGTIIYRDGQITVEYLDDLDFACEVWGYDPDEIRAEYDDEDNESLYENSLDTLSDVTF